MSSLVKDVTGAEVPLETDWGYQAHRAAVDHLSRVWAHFHNEDGYEDPDAASPAVGAFCGCQDCEVREALFAAVPFLEAGLRREYQRAAGSIAPVPALTVNLVQCPQEDTNG